MDVTEVGLKVDIIDCRPTRVRTYSVCYVSGKHAVTRETLDKWRDIEQAYWNMQNELLELKKQE